MTGQFSQRSSAGASRATRAAFMPALAAVLVALLVSFALLLIPISAERAYAAPYEYSHASINAQVQTDASVRVVEHRVLSFSGDCDQYQQEYHGLQKNQQLVINDVRIAPVDELGNVVGDWQRLSPVAFRSEWRRTMPSDKLAELTQSGSYAYDMTKHITHMYFPAHAGDNIVVEFDYSVVNGALAYKDVADVSIKYVGDSFQADSHDVTFTITLPVLESVQAMPGKNVYAWGHGPENGTFENQGAAVVYTDEFVKAGQYAEAHVVFPSNWLRNISGSDSRLHRDEMHLNWILNNEEGWQDRFRYGAITDDRVSIVLVAVALLALFASLAACLRFRNEPQSLVDAGAEESVSRGRDLLRGMHPAVAVRLREGGRQTDREFALTIMSLCDRGVLRVSSAAAEGAAAEGEAADKGSIKISRASFDLFDDEADQAVMAIFDAVANDQGDVVLPLAAHAAIDGPAFLEAVRVWEAAVSRDFNAQEFVDLSGAAWGKRLRRFGVVLVFLALVALVATTCILAAALLVVASFAVFVASAETKRFTQKTVDDLALFNAYADALVEKDEFDQREILDASVLGLSVDCDGSCNPDAVADAVERAIPSFFKLAHRRQSRIAAALRDMPGRFKKNKSKQ